MSHQPDTADLARRVMEAAEKATEGPWHWVNPDTDEPCQPGEMGSDLRTVEEFGEDKTVERDGKTYTTWRLPKWILASVEFRHDAEANAAFIALSRTAAPALAQAVLEKGEAFQPRVLPWLIECFGAEIASDRVERCDRFIEEALELAQSLDWTADRAHALVDYVFGRPKGEPHQEVGGVMVTLAALCQAVDLDMHKAGDDELARIMQPEIVAKIRAKQAAKPTGSALPVAQSKEPAS